MAKPKMAQEKNPAKVGKVMREFKAGDLHSGSKKGPKVTAKKQAIAIALSEAGLSRPSPYSSSTKPRVHSAPKTLAGRRAASHAKLRKG